MFKIMEYYSQLKLVFIYIVKDGSASLTGGEAEVGWRGVWRSGGTGRRRAIHSLLSLKNSAAETSSPSQS